MIHLSCPKMFKFIERILEFQDLLEDQCQFQIQLLSMKTMKNKEKIYIFAIENIFNHAKNRLDVKICSMELHNCGHNTESFDA